MKITFSDLWRSSGTVDRGPYALVGLIGFTLKHNLDRLVAAFVFHRPWTLFNYWVPVRNVARVTGLGGGDAVFLATMVVLSLPFVWVGVTLTAKRLRSANLPSALVILFFVPFLNLLFFLFLCLVPARNSDVTQPEAKPPRATFLARVIPESALGSAALSLLFTVPAGLGMAVMSAQLLRNYGWGLFVALPFTMGFAAALIYGVRQPRSLGGCMGVACLSTALLVQHCWGWLSKACSVFSWPCPSLCRWALLEALSGTWCSGDDGCTTELQHSFPPCSSLFQECNGWSMLLLPHPLRMWFVPRSTSKPRPKRSGNEWFLFLKFLRLRSGCFEPVSLIPSALRFRAPGSARNGIACSPPARLLSPLRFGMSRAR